MHYKRDSSFQRFLAMSVAGELAAMLYMEDYGHAFECDGYGAGDAAIYKDQSKKRKRTADLRCVRCGRKLEVRSKSRIKIAMSDSLTRPFDSELRAEDWVGFTKVIAIEAPSENSHAAVGELYVFSVAELTRTRELTRLSAPKSKEQGLEKYIEWPTIVSPCDGNIQELSRSSGIVIESDIGFLKTICPPHGWFLYGRLRVGSPVIENTTVLAGVAKPLKPSELMCI